jgi:hypothetical protein
MHWFLKFILERKSICFGQFLCPSSVFHCTQTAVVYVIQVCWQTASRIRMVPSWSCTVKNSWWWTEELSETCRVSFQNKFEKLLHLVGFIIRNLSRCTVTWTTNYHSKFQMFSFRVHKMRFPKGAEQLITWGWEESMEMYYSGTYRHDLIQHDAFITQCVRGWLSSSETNSMHAFPIVYLHE